MGFYGNTKKLSLNPGEYKLKEIASPAGYQIASEIIFRITLGGKIELLQNNVWIPTDSAKIEMIDHPVSSLINISVKKEWVGKGKDSVTVNLLADGKKVKSQILNAANGWKHTFTDLNTYNGGHEISYTISEDNIDGYNISITGNMTDGFTVKNTNNEKISIPVNKKWIGPSRDTAEVILSADGSEVQRVTLNKGNGWKHTFTNLLKYDSKTGKEIKYTLAEAPIVGYDATVTGDQNNGFTVTNTQKSKPDKLPQTGDVSNLGFLGLMLVGSGGMLLGLNHKKRKK